MFNRKELDPAFADQLDILLATMKDKHSLIFVPYFGLRSPLDQAKLWRQSRSMDQIHAAYGKLLSAGAPYLAKCLLDAGPQSGAWKTNALPGQSWHQFGSACDCYWLKDGQISWTGEAYQVYADEAEAMGLHSLRAINDIDHVQASHKNSPQDEHPLSWIDNVLRTKFAR